MIPRLSAFSIRKLSRFRFRAIRPKAGGRTEAEPCMNETKMKVEMNKRDDDG